MYLTLVYVTINASVSYLKRNYFIPNFLIDAQAVHCEWGEWVVGECSATCGEGLRTDVREQVVSAKNGGIECAGEASITERCHAGDCPPRKKYISYTLKTSPMNYLFIKRKI